MDGPGGEDWISTVHNTLGAAARDEPLDEATLDRIYESYGASEPQLRSAFEDFQALSRRALYRFLRPSIAMPMMELVAMAHGCRGTWA